MRIASPAAALVAAALTLGAGARSSIASDDDDARDRTRVSLRGVDLERSTILEIQEAMERGRISAVELTIFYLQRIRRINPELNAVIVTSPRAVLEAALSDVRRRFHALRSPMDGIPILLKDNVDTRVVATTAGSE